MHGTILSELQNFITVEFGLAFRNQMQHAAGVGPRIYMPITTYPDAEALALVQAAAQLSGRSAPELLTAFGEFLAPKLLEMYRHFVSPAWRTLDVLEHTESTIHRIVRLREPGATPPRLVCTRVSDNEVLIAYDSPRRLCSLGIGLAVGLAGHYAETLHTTQSQCMNEGASRCLISFRLITKAPGI
jgi:hypothetical protein